MAALVLAISDGALGFSVATDERFTDKNGEKQERVDWHQVVVYGKIP